MHSSKIVVKSKTRNEPTVSSSRYVEIGRRDLPLRQGGCSPQTFTKEQTTIREQTTSIPAGQVRLRSEKFSSPKREPFTTVTCRPQSAPFPAQSAHFTTVPKGKKVNTTYDEARFSKPLFEVERRHTTHVSEDVSKLSPNSNNPTASGSSGHLPSRRVNDRSKYGGFSNKKPGMADSQFRDDVIKAHNEYRSKHQACPLTHSSKLSEYAQKWADQLARTDTFQHSKCILDDTQERLGENIAMKWSSTPGAYSGQEVTDQWYDEIKMYTFGQEPRTLSSGHFTQVVWKGSREMGVGKAQTKEGKVIVVASYRPAGNMAGRFTENVLPPKDGKIVVPEPRNIPVSNISSSDKSQNFSRRFERDIPATSSKMSTTKQVRTFTETTGSGTNKETKVTVETTITKPDGSKTVTKEVTITKGEASGCSDDTKHGGGRIGDQMGKLSLEDDDFFKRSDSSPDKDSKNSSKSKSQSPKEFIEEALKAHNEKRKLHRVSPLEHSKDLSDYAQNWAERLASRGQFQHSDCLLKGERLGENISFSYDSRNPNGYSGAQATEQWYSEISKHNYNADHQPGTGHFTQVVWKGSKEFGIGKALDANGKCYIVGSYRPAGNMVGTFRDNVFPPK